MAAVTREQSSAATAGLVWKNPEGGTENLPMPGNSSVRYLPLKLLISPHHEKVERKKSVPSSGRTVSLKEVLISGETSMHLSMGSKVTLSNPRYPAFPFSQLTLSRFRQPKRRGEGNMGRRSPGKF